MKNINNQLVNEFHKRAPQPRTHSKSDKLQHDDTTTVVYVVYERFLVAKYFLYDI